MKSKLAQLPCITASLLLACALIFSGCESANTPENRVVFPNVSINGQPAQLILDTSEPSSALTGPTAERLGVKFTPLSRPVARQMNQETDTDMRMHSQGLSEPVQLTVGTETVTVQLPVDKQLSWILRGFIEENRDIDGVIGWPDLQDNILVFDGARRTVSAVASLPAETAGWTKLKIHPGDQLLLESPLPDGNTGTILVDTASPLGVTLPPAPWKDWRAKFPHAEWIDNTHVPPTNKISMADIWHADDRMADEITIGPITLTAVPAHLAWPAEIAPFDNYAGSLGLAALTRMDLVVDGKGGFAYVRPKPAPDPAAVKSDADSSPLARKDWTVEGDLHLKADRLLAASGALKSASGDYDGAMADFSRALELDPQSADAYLQRADAKEKKGDDDGAIADFNQALTLEPKNVQAYLNRGTARKNNGDLDGALADFSQAIEIDPNNPAAYAHRAGARGIMDDANGEIADLTRVLELEPQDVKRRDTADFNRVVNAYLNRGSAEGAKGDLAAAVADYTHAIELIPDSSPIGYEARADSKNSQGDYDGAIADYSHVLKTDSKYVEAYFGRARSKTFKGDYAGALADFDHGFQLDPQNPAYLVRGVARDSHGDFSGALADFDQAIALSPGDSAYTRLYRELVLRRLGRPPEDFSAIVANFKNGWPKTLGEYLAAQLDETALLTAAAQKGREPVSRRACEAYYCIGMLHLLNHDPAGARENWQRAVATHETTENEYLLAQSEIARLDSSPAK
jgi:tetratricopeptide (TPR) repeat protein